MACAAILTIGIEQPRPMTDVASLRPAADKVEGLKRHFFSHAVWTANMIAARFAASGRDARVHRTDDHGVIIRKNRCFY